MMSKDHQIKNIEETLFTPMHAHLQPRIFEGPWQGESLPLGFNAITIELDGRVHSDLNWKTARIIAQQAIENGYNLMWNMQMGLFNDLTQPLTNQTQFLSLTLALEHFRDSLWKEFKTQTIGLTLFRGPAEFSKGFRWDDNQKQNLQQWFQEIDFPHLATLNYSQLMQGEEKQLINLYCRNVTIEYLLLLTAPIPDSLPVYLFLDCFSLPRSFADEMQILNPERFDHLQLALKGHQLPFNVMGWENPTLQGYSGNSLQDLPPMQTTTVGICLPLMHFYQRQPYQDLEIGIRALQKKSISFKLIPECHLTSQWDGLDYLLYSPNGLSSQGKRKLQGFCAAGGTAISMGDLLGLTQELKLTDWI